jgi:hypothetical protein
MCYLLLVSADFVTPDQGFSMSICRLISATDGNLPNKPCQTCKNSFHASCLYEVRELSVYPVFPDQQSADGRPPASSGSRAATHLAVLCVVLISLNRCRVGVNPLIRECACVVLHLNSPFPRRPHLIIYLLIVLGSGSLTLRR